MSFQFTEAVQTKYNALQEAFDALQREISYAALPNISLSQKVSGHVLQERIDAELNLLHLHLAKVHEQIAIRHRVTNTFIPINKLPNEILSNILQISVVDSSSYIIQLENYGNIEQVCFHWRDLMKLRPLVFSDASLSRNNRVITESGSAPLDIVFTDYDQDLMELLYLHVHRWRSFEAHLEDPPDHEWMMHFRNAAPLLQSFSVSFDTINYETPLINLFGGNAPRLSCLQITNVVIPWDSGLLQGLQILHLRAFDGSDAPSIPAMQRVLEACPQLQDFMLCGSATLSSNPFIRQPPVAIQLPRLQILHLDDVHPNIVRWLLESIQAPPFSKLCVDVEFYNDAVFVETLQGLPTHGVLEQAAQTVSSGKTRMVLGDDGSASWIQFGSVAHPKIRSPPPILSIYCPRDLHQLGNPIPLVSSIFPSWTKTLTILEIYDEQFYAFPENYGRIANEFLCELIELKTLVISHSRVDQSSILVALGSVKVESGIMHWPCPKLTRLELRGLLWFFADALASCVRLRYGHRLPISSQLPVPLESLQVQESCLIYNGAFHATISEIEEIIGGGIIEVEPLGAGLSHRTLLS